MAININNIEEKFSPSTLLENAKDKFQLENIEGQLLDAAKKERQAASATKDPTAKQALVEKAKSYDDRRRTVNQAITNFKNQIAKLQGIEGELSVMANRADKKNGESMAALEQEIIKARTAGKYIDFKQVKKWGAQKREFFKIANTDERARRSAKTKEDNSISSRNDKFITITKYIEELAKDMPDNADALSLLRETVGISKEGGTPSLADIRGLEAKYKSLGGKKGEFKKEQAAIASQKEYDDLKPEERLSIKLDKAVDKKLKALGKDETVNDIVDSIDPPLEEYQKQKLIGLASEKTPSAVGIVNLVKNYQRGNVLAKDVPAEYKQQVVQMIVDAPTESKKIIDGFNKAWKTGVEKLDPEVLKNRMNRWVDTQSQYYASMGKIKQLEGTKPTTQAQRDTIAAQLRVEKSKLPGLKKIAEGEHPKTKAEQDRDDTVAKLDKIKTRLAELPAEKRATHGKKTASQRLFEESRSLRTEQVKLQKQLPELNKAVQEEKRKLGEEVAVPKVKREGFGVEASRARLEETQEKKVADTREAARETAVTEGRQVKALNRIADTLFSGGQINEPQHRVLKTVANTGDVKQFMSVKDMAVAGATEDELKVAVQGQPSEQEGVVEPAPVEVAEALPEGVTPVPEGVVEEVTPGVVDVETGAVETAPQVTTAEEAIDAGRAEDEQRNAELERARVAREQQRQDLLRDKEAIRAIALQKAQEIKALQDELKTVQTSEDIDEIERSVEVNRITKELQQKNAEYQEQVNREGDIDIQLNNLQGQELLASDQSDGALIQTNKDENIDALIQTKPIRDKAISIMDKAKNRFKDRMPPGQQGGMCPRKKQIIAAIKAGKLLRGDVAVLLKVASEGSLEVFEDALRMAMKRKQVSITPGTERNIRMSEFADKCAPGKCIRKEGNWWRVVSNKTGKLWPQKYKTEAKAKAALAAYHIGKG